MEYIELDTYPHYKECSLLVEGLGYLLVELRIVPSKTQYNVRAVIARQLKNSETSTSVADNEKTVDLNPIGISDCAKVHRLIQPRIEALLNTQDISMEVTSPGMERNIKNAAEFKLFIGRGVRVWSTEVSDWIPGTIISADKNGLVMEIVNAERKTVTYDLIAKAKLLNS